MTSAWHLGERFDTQAGVVAAGKAGQGPDLVLAHGWPWSSYSWHRIIPALAESYRVHWYDMPGYGRSDMTVKSTALDTQSLVFAEMLDNWGLSEPWVIAHDFGGATTLRANILHGCAFDRLTLMNAVALSPWGSKFFDHVQRHVEAFSGVPPHIHRGIAEVYIKGAFAKSINQADYDALVSPWLSEAGQQSFYNQFVQADEKYTDEIESSLSSIACRVDVIWGEDDPWIPIERGRKLASIIDGSSFTPLPGVGHMPQIEQPELVLRTLAQIT